MTRYDKLIKMFEIVHGKLDSSKSSLEINDELDTISVLKYGKFCWSVTVSDLLFDYTTRNWGKL